MLKGKLLIILLFIFILTLNVHAIQCGSCINCEIINIRKECLKCLQGYRLNSATGQCDKIQSFVGQLRRVVSIIIDDNQPSQNIQSNSVNMGASAAKNMINSNNLTGNISQSPSTNQKSFVISTIIDGPINQQIKSTISISNILPEIFTVDINCLRYQGRICKKCAFRFVLLEGKCKRVGSGCQTWNQLGKCLTCYQGFSVNDKGECLLVELKTPTTLPTNLVLEPKPSTTPTTPIIPTPSTTSTTSSIPVITQTKIITPPPPPAPVLIANCAQFRADGSCKKCAFKHYKVNNQCKPINNDCKLWNSQTGGCTQCYSGFELKQSQCQKRIVPQFKPLVFVPPPVKGCAQLSPEGVCQKCALRFVLINGFCKNVIDQCQTWQVATGDCKQCYSGYKLSGFNCIKQEPKIENKQTYIRPQTLEQDILTLDDIKFTPKKETQDDFDQGQVLFQKKQTTNS